MYQASSALMIAGSIILVFAFVMQIKRMYKLKTSHGINVFSWVQNYIGRSLFIVYGMFIPGPVGFTLMISQGLVGLFSIPMIYYYFRNKRAQGDYVKEHFSNKIFALRISMIVAIVSLMIVGILMREEVSVINYDHPSDTTILIISLFASVIASTSFIPQAIKLMKSKNTKSLSLPLTVLFVIGNVLIITSFILSAVDQDNFPKYAAPTIMTIIAASAMTINLSIKINNVIKTGEKI